MTYKELLENTLNTHRLGLSKRVQDKAKSKDAIENVSFIQFEDSEVERICHEHDVFTIEDAKQVKSVEGWFSEYKGFSRHPSGIMSVRAYKSSEIRKFKEFKYFTGITNIKNCFRADPDINNISSLLKSISLPEGLKIIGNNAFARCRNLENINIPGTVVEIGNEAFYATVGLQKINLPNSIRKIGKYAFSKSSLKSIIIPNYVGIIEENTFSGCNMLNSVTLQNELKRICSGAFSFIPQLTINIPDSVDYIDPNAFMGVKNLTFHISKNSPLYSQLKDGYPSATFIELVSNSSQPQQKTKNIEVTSESIDQIIQNFLEKKNKKAKSCLGDFVTKDEILNWVFSKRYWNQNKFNFEQILKDISPNNYVDFIFDRFEPYNSFSEWTLPHVFNKEKYIKELEGKIERILPIIDVNHDNGFGSNCQLELSFDIARDLSATDGFISILCDHDRKNPEKLNQNNKEHTEIIYGQTKDSETFKNMIRSIIGYINDKRNSKNGKRIIQKIKNCNQELLENIYNLGLAKKIRQQSQNKDAIYNKKHLHLK